MRLHRVAALLLFAAACSTGPRAIAGADRVSDVRSASPSPVTDATPLDAQSPTAVVSPLPLPTEATRATPPPAPTPVPPPQPTTPAPTTPEPGPQPGGAPELDACPMFPPDNPWNQRIDDLPVHPNSEDFVDAIGRFDTMHPDFGTVWQGAPIGIPWTTVPGNQPLVPLSFDYASESDPGPYPIPPDAPIEAGSDRHILVVDTDNCVLWEVFAASTDDGGASWHAGSGARFDLRSNALRPAGWTSADAAGLPILPGLVRWEEVVDEGVIDHALRFTVSQTQRGWIAPARHFASSSTDPDHPPMGLRLRMKASWDCSEHSREVRVICTALKRYGMFVADNGSDWYVSGAPDSRWDDDRLRDLKDIPGDAFEAVDTGPIVTG